MATHLELGLDTFGDITTGPDGQLLPHAQVIRDVIDEAILADSSVSISSASASTIAPTSPSPRRTWCWRRSRGAPAACVSARR